MSIGKSAVATLLFPIWLSACSSGGNAGPPEPLPLPYDLRPSTISDLAVPDLHSTPDLRQGGGTPTFAAPIHCEGGNEEGTMTVGDLNRDGIPDIVLVDDIYTPYGFDVCLGKGDGTLLPTYKIFADRDRAKGTAAVVADFDIDGKPDVLATSFDSSSLIFSKGLGDGTLMVPQRLAIPDTAQDLTVADFNGDGRPDVAIACSASNKACLLNGKAPDTFDAVRTVFTGQFPVGIAAGDLNGDKVTDLVLSAYKSSALTILIGKGDGTFVAQPGVKSALGPFHIVLIDLNRDGALDAVVTDNQFSGTGVSVHLGDGKGGLGTRKAYASADRCVGLVVTDLNGDGNLDVAATEVTNNLVIFLGHGDGTLAAPISMPTMLSPRDLSTGDWNRDGKPDLVVSTINQGGGYLYLNTTP